MNVTAVGTWLATGLRAGAVGLLVCGSAWAQKQGEPITLNFVGAEIEAVARTMGVITGRTVVVDPRVRGTINLSSEKPQSPSAAYAQFVAALRLQGYTVVESGGIYKVVPEAEGKLQGQVVSVAPDQPAGNQIVTQIFRLDHESALNMVPVLRPLISPNNTINVNPGSNALVITDYADNLRRLSRIIAAMDMPNATDVEVIPLKHALAADLAPLVLRLTQSGNAVAVQGQVDNSFRTAIIAEPRSNALIVRAANPARVALVRSLVERLDQPSSEDASGNIHVVYLKNAEAVKLAATLRAAMASAASSTSAATAVPGRVLTGGAAAAAAAAAAASSSSSQSETGGQIQADPATNSLVITAPEPQYRQMRAVIDKLDARRAQVFVESLIAEVNADKAAEFGIQWQGPIGKNGDGSIGILGTNFGSGGNNIISLATGAANGSVVPGSGLNVGVAGRANGVYYLGFLARFLQSTGDGNILSTPNLLTLDNEEAKIVIGQNVPFVTGSYTNNNAGGTGTVNPFQTIERKDVGLTLRVKPQISENGTIRLSIFQEVSSVQASSVNSPSGLITNKRSIESNVLVDDGSIVVLGGLLQDESANNEEKVPGLGDVPLFGNLFRSETRSRKKTNLMVFLRPVVVRDGASLDSLSMGRYEMMRSDQTAVQPRQSVVLPDLGTAQLPPAPPPKPQPQPRPVEPRPVGGAAR
jgi:general secretion pathway protein D